MLSATESFEYDSADRLIGISEGNSTVMELEYQANGNIAYKTGIGEYDYANSRPHAVRGVENADNLLSENEQAITYTAFDKVASIHEVVGTDTCTLNIHYGSDKQRWKSILTKNGSVIRTTLFADDYEEITENGVTKQLHYIYGSDGLAAIYIKQDEESHIYYAHTDHLGSIVKLTDDNGTAYFNASYDAWGKQTVTTNTINFHRGYTGHEHLSEFNLINMNGRMYDPLLARFLSPDPFVQMPDFSQSYNRYSYALNNPLMYTDPDGELAWFIPLIIGSVIGAASGGIMAKQAGAQGFWQWAGFVGGGALIGGLSGGAATGVSMLGGAAWLAGAAAGMVGGAGFSGLATNWNVNAMLKGAAIGAVSGFVGGGVASAIGGGWGAMIGGSASNITSQLMNNGGVNWASVAVSAALSYGMYHGMQYAAWKWGGGNNIGGQDITYRQFSAINTAYQRSRFWGREFGVYLNNDGSARITPWRDTEKMSVSFRSSLGNTNKTMHAHWAKDGQEWVELPSGKFQRYSGDPTAYPTNSYLHESVGGYHSPADLNLPGYSLVVGRTSSTYFLHGASNYTYIQSDPFLRFFLFNPLNLKR
jgi:RHS repeat-associated protein